MCSSTMRSLHYRLARFDRLCVVHLKLFSPTSEFKGKKRRLASKLYSFCKYQECNKIFIASTNLLKTLVAFEYHLKLIICFASMQLSLKERIDEWRGSTQIYKFSIRVQLSSPNYIDYQSVVDIDCHGGRFFFSHSKFVFL